MGETIHRTKLTGIKRKDDTTMLLSRISDIFFEMVKRMMSLKRKRKRKSQLEIKKIRESSFIPAPLSESFHP